MVNTFTFPPVSSIGSLYKSSTGPKIEKAEFVHRSKCRVRHVDSVCSCTQSSAFSIPIFASWGDRGYKTLVGIRYSIRSQSSSFWPAHHWWLTLTPIRLWAHISNGVGGSEVVAKLVMAIESRKIDSGIRIWLGGNSRSKYPEMYDCNSAGQWSGEDLVMWSLGDFQDTSCPLWDCRPCNFNCKVHFNKKWSLRLTMLLYDRYSKGCWYETKRSS